MPSVRKSASPPAVSEATVSRIVDAVLRSPRMSGAMVALGISSESVRKSALAKLRKAGVVAGLSKREARIRSLEAKLASAGPVEAVEIRRALAFAKREGGAK